VDVAAFVISILAFLAAGAAAFYTRSQSLASDRQAKAAEDALAIERERRADERVARERAEEALRDATEAKRAAHVYVTIDPQDWDQNEVILYVNNQGPSMARDVKFSFGPALDGRSLPPLAPAASVQWAEIFPNDRVPMRHLRAAEASSRYQVTVTWTDDRGPQQRTQAISG
jgi:hypothetical protein